MDNLAFRDLELTSAFCYLKTTSGVLDENGKNIASGISAFFTGAPRFSLVNPDTGIVADRMFIFVKIKCNTNIDVENQNQIPLIAKPSAIEVVVLSKDSQNQRIETFNHQITTEQKTLSNGNEFTIATFEIPIDSILLELDNGSYDSLQEIRISGDIKLNYEGFSFTYTFSIPKDCNDAFNCPNTFLHLAVKDNLIGKPKGTTDPVIEATPNPSKDGEKKPTGENITTTDLIEEFRDCLILTDFDCLAQQKFLPFYALGFIGIVAIGVTSRRSPEMIRVVSNG